MNLNLHYKLIKLIRVQEKTYMLFENFDGDVPVDAHILRMILKSQNIYSVLQFLPSMAI